MKINVAKSTFVSAIHKLTNIADEKASRPILSNLVMQTIDENEIELYATNYTTDIAVRVAATVLEEGAVCINAKKLHDSAKAFLADECVIENNDPMWTNIANGKTKLRLPGQDVGLYPLSEKGMLQHQFSMPTRTLIDVIDQCLFAAQVNESRKNLMGIHMMKDGDTVVFEATDGHRLARKSVLMEEVLFNAADVIIPATVCAEIKKTSEAFDEKMNIQFDESAMRFDSGRISIKTRLIEGKFPNCDPIIPKDNSLTLEVDRGRLMQSLKIVSAISSEKLRPSKMILTKNKLLMESEKAEYGNVNDEIEVSYNGDDFQIGFNCRYLLDALSVMTTENVVLFLKSDMSPVLIRQPNDDSFLTVIMPLRVDW